MKQTLHTTEIGNQTLRVEHFSEGQYDFYSPVFSQNFIFKITSRSKKKDKSCENDVANQKDPLKRNSFHCVACKDAVICSCENLSCNISLFHIKVVQPQTPFNIKVMDS